MSDLSRDSHSEIQVIKQLHRTPTKIYPPPQTILRTSFRHMHQFATVSVGQAPGARYFVHRDLLISASPFFAAALDGNFIEGEEQTVSLSEEKPETFEWFLWWLYTGSLTSPTEESCDQPKTGRCRSCNKVHSKKAYSEAPSTIHADGDLRNRAGSPKYFLLFDLYALSDSLMTTALSNHILDTVARLSESTNSVPTPSDTWILYDIIRESAPIRTLILDLFAYKKTDKLLETHCDEWHPLFLRDLIVRIKRPGSEVMERHTLTPCRISAWPQTRACESCREVLRPGHSGQRCSTCERMYCASCFRGKRYGHLGGDVGPCKPWTGKICERYHEHDREHGTNPAEAIEVD